MTAEAQEQWRGSSSGKGLGTVAQVGQQQWHRSKGSGGDWVAAGKRGVYLYGSCLVPCSCQQSPPGTLSSVGGHGLLALAPTSDHPPGYRRNGGLNGMLVSPALVHPVCL